MEDGNEVGLPPGRFPFTLVLASLLVRGMVFAFLNGPLLWLTLQGSEPETIGDLLSAVVPLAKSALGYELSAPLLTVLLFAIVLIGFALTPVQSIVLYLVQGLAIPIYRTWNRGDSGIRKMCHLPYRQRNPQPFLDANIYAAEDYIPLVSWLFRNPHAKGHWEWQFFHNHLYWGLVANAVIFAIIALSGVSSLSIAGVIAVCSVPIIFCLCGLYHSNHTARVYRFYLAKAKIRRSPEP